MGMMINRRRVCGGEKLPCDAEVEYLEGTGLQYIDTGIIPLLTDYVYAEFMLLTPFDSSDASCTIYGVMNSWERRAFCFSFAQNKNQIIACRGNSRGSMAILDFQRNANLWQTMSINSTVFTAFGKTITVSNDPQECQYNAFLFTCNLNNTLLYGMGTSKRIRRFRHKRNGEFIRDFIPVRVGQVGYMYDKVSGQLFGNSGTGDFILGPDV